MDTMPNESYSETSSHELVTGMTKVSGQRNSSGISWFITKIKFWDKINGIEVFCEFG